MDIMIKTKAVINLFCGDLQHANECFHDVLSDTLWLVGQECDLSEGNGSEELTSRFTEFIKRIVKNAVCPIHLLDERMEVTMLAKCGLVNDNFQRVMNRTNTQRYYTQKKFNLIRDENEGYSKLIAFLHQPTINPSTLASTLSSYISLFDLDPNRVFDMILDACEVEKSKYSVFRTVFEMFKAEDVARLLEFKMNYFKKQNVSDYYCY